MRHTSQVSADYPGTEWPGNTPTHLTPTGHFSLRPVRDPLLSPLGGLARCRRPTPCPLSLRLSGATQEDSTEASKPCDSQRGSGRYITSPHRVQITAHRHRKSAAGTSLPSCRPAPPLPLCVPCMLPAIQLHTHRKLGPGLTRLRICALRSGARGADALDLAGTRKVLSDSPRQKAELAAGAPGYFQRGELTRHGDFQLILSAFPR